jgi:hypothetical protein
MDGLATELAYITKSSYMITIFRVLAGYTVEGSGRHGVPAPCAVRLFPPLSARPGRPPRPLPVSAPAQLDTAVTLVTEKSNN